MISKAQQMKNKSITQLLILLPTVIGKTEIQLKKIIGNPIKIEKTDIGKELTYRQGNRIGIFSVTGGKIKAINATELSHSHVLANTTYKTLIVAYRLEGYTGRGHTAIKTLMKKGLLNLTISLGKNETAYFVNVILTKGIFDANQFPIKLDS